MTDVSGCLLRDAPVAPPMARSAPVLTPDHAFGPAAMHCIRRGTGKPLVLLHGLGGSSRSWQPILDELAKERAVVALDLPGFGRTRPLAVPLSIPHLADQVTAFMTAHDLLGSDVAGMSMGGRLALELARRGTAGTVVALDPGGFASGWRRTSHYWVMSASIRMLRWLRPALPKLVSGRAGRTLLGMLLSPRPWRLRPDVVRDELDGCASAPGFDELLRSMTFGPPPLGTGPQPAGKIIVGWGRRDRICRPDQAPRVLNLFPTAQIHWFDEAGHFPLWDCPAETTRLILRSTA